MITRTARDRLRAGPVTARDPVAAPRGVVVGTEDPAADHAHDNDHVKTPSQVDAYGRPSEDRRQEIGEPARPPPYGGEAGRIGGQSDGNTDHHPNCCPQTIERQPFPSSLAACNARSLYLDGLRRLISAAGGKRTHAAYMLSTKSCICDIFTVGRDSGIRTQHDSLDSVGYRLHVAAIAMNASIAVAPCTPLHPKQVAPRFQSSS